MIQVRGLEKCYPGAAAPTLRGVDFAVPQGTLAALLGTSGAGKTTLLRCLCGLEPFDRGSITVGAATICGGGAAARASDLRGKVGLVFQGLELFPHLCVLDNCTLAPMRALGVPRAAAEARARALLGELGLADKADAWPAQLSGGQRQRVAITRALATEPRVLLYDEPTSALDPQLKREVRETLLRVRATGVTQIVVTHDVALARETAELVFILDTGVIADQGPPATLFASPVIAATRRLLQHG